MSANQPGDAETLRFVLVLVPQAAGSGHCVLAQPEPFAQRSGAMAPVQNPCGTDLRPRCHAAALGRGAGGVCSPLHAGPGPTDEVHRGVTRNKVLACKGLKKDTCGTVGSSRN